MNRNNSYTWFTHDSELVKSTLNNINNGLVISEDGFKNLKGFIFTHDKLPSYDKRFDLEEDYQYVVHHSLRLYDEILLKEYASETGKSFPIEYDENEKKYKDSMEAIIRVIANSSKEEYSKEVIDMVRYFGCLTEEYANRRNCIVTEFMEN